MTDAHVTEFCSLLVKPISAVCCVLSPYTGKWRQWRSAVARLCHNATEPLLRGFCKFKFLEMFTILMAIMMGTVVDDP
jgi:hypothetical protein